MSDLQPDLRQGQLAEYASLRSMLTGLEQSLLQSAGIMIPIASGLEIVGIQQRSTVLLMTGVLLLIGTAWGVTAIARNIVLISTYIYAVLEEESGGLRWEHMSLELKDNGGGLLPSATKFAAIFYCLVITGLIILAGGFLPNHGKHTLLLYGGAAVGLAILMLWTATRAIRVNSRGFAKKLVQKWKTIQEDAKSKKSQSIPVSAQQEYAPAGDQDA